MNRSILIVICDFLLVSLLMFSSPDMGKMTSQGPERGPRLDITATNQVDAGKDLTAVMQLALADERKGHAQLQNELAKSQAAITEREKQTQLFQQQLQARDEQARQLQQQFAAAQTNIQELNQQLQGSSTESVLTKEKLAAMEAEARKQSEQAAALKQQLDQMNRSNQMVLNEKQQLAGQLQLAEVEKRHATEQVTRMTEEVKIEREEKAKLVEGVKVLANKSGELTQEIRENRPLAPNLIFSEFIANRVAAGFDAVQSGFFGAKKHKDAETILVTDGTNTFAVCHVQDTSLTLWNPGTKWDGLTGTLVHNGVQLPIKSMTFHSQDPRVVMVPVTPEEVTQLGSKVYKISADPFKFQDAVLVGAQEGYYGECKFQIDLTTPDYVQLDRSLLKGLFGKFNPSRGDLVFSRTGELLGIMANSTYCMMIQNFNGSVTFRFGDDVRAQHTGDMLSLLYSEVLQLPFKLQ